MQLPWLGQLGPLRPTTHQGSILKHPYFPQDAEIPGYIPNATPLPILLGSFSSIITIVLISTLTLARRANRRLTYADQFFFCWFVLCGSLHCFFEGYFVLNHSELASSQSLLAQVWKEYALSDSRYLTSDPFTLCVEAVTVLVWGPLCYVIAIGIVRGSSLRFPLQIVMSIAHLYGVALYYATCHAEYVYRGFSYSRPEMLYFWVYYVGLNAPWVAVPAIMLWKSVRRIQRVFRAFEKMNLTLEASGKTTEVIESKKTK